MKKENDKGVVLRIAGEIPEALKYPLKLIEDNYVVVRDNSKKILVSIGVVAMAFTGCGRRVVNPAKPGSGNFEKDPGNSSSVSDTNVESTITEDTTTGVIEEDGTTRYYVSDELGTSYIEPQDVVTSGLYSSGVSGRKTTKTTPVGDETTTSYNDETTKLGDETTRLTEETTNNTTRNYYTTSNSKATTSKTTTSKTTTNTTRGTVTTSKTTTSKTTTTTTKKDNSSEPEIDGYKLSEILNVPRAFSTFSCGLQYDMGYVSASKFPFSGLSFSYGPTAGEYESKIVLLILNSEYMDMFSSETLTLISRFKQEYLYTGKEFFSKYKYITTTLGTSVDFTKYTLNRELGLYLNKIVDAYKNGNFDNFIVDQYVNKKMNSKFLNNPAVLTLLYSFDSGHKYISQSYLDENYLNPFINDLSYRAYGTPYYTETGKKYTK